MGRPGGIFECDSCGMQYDTAWAKEKIQEIKGTVKVEGTVQVAGTVRVETPVRVEGSVTLENLLKRMEMSLSEEDFDKVGELAEQALNIDPECGEIYLWQYLAQLRMRSLDVLLSAPAFFLKHCLPKRLLWVKAVRYGCPGLQQRLDGAIAQAEKEFRQLPAGWNAATLADEALKADPECGEAYLLRLMANHRVSDLDALSVCDWEQLKGIWRDPDWEMAKKYYIPPDGMPLSQRFAEALEKHKEARREQEKLLALKGQQMAQAREKQKKRNEERRERHGQLKPLQQILWVGEGYILALKADGTMLVTHDGGHGWLESVRNWENIRKIYVRNDEYILGLRWDGTMVGAFRNERAARELQGISQWKNIADFACCKYQAICFGVTELGTLLSAPNGREPSTDKSNSTVYYAGGSGYTNLKQLAAFFEEIPGCRIPTYYAYAIGVTQNGRLVGPNASGLPENQKNLMAGWNLNQWKDVVELKHIADDIAALFRDGSIEKIIQKQQSTWSEIRHTRIDFNIREDGSCGKWNDVAVYRQWDFGYPDVAVQLNGNLLVDDEKIQNIVKEWKPIAAAHVFNREEKYVAAAVQEDGTVLAAWSEHFGDVMSVEDWKLFDRFDTFQAEQREAVRKYKDAVRAREMEHKARQIANLKAAREKRMAEKAEIKGLFAGMRRKDIDRQIEAIDAELRKMGAALS